MGAGTPTSIPIHPVFPADSHLTPQSLQVPICAMGYQCPPHRAVEGTERREGCRWAFQSMRCGQASASPTDLKVMSQALLSNQTTQTGSGMGTGRCNLCRTDRRGTPGMVTTGGWSFPHPKGARPTNLGWPGAPPNACPRAPCQLPLPLGAAVPQGLLEPLQAVDGERAVLPGLQEALHVGQEDVAGGEEAGAQPEQLPAPLLAVPAGRGVVSGRAPRAHHRV